MRFLGAHRTLVVLMALTTLPAFAVPKGGSAGGGGMAHVCRDPTTKKVSSIELLDLYRAEVQSQDRFQINRIEAPYEVQLEEGIRPIAFHHWNIYDQMNVIREEPQDIQFVN